MALTFRSASSVSINSATVTVDKPSGVQSGDFLIAIMGYWSAGDPITPPSGWTLLDATANSSATYSKGAVYYKFAGGSEPSTYTWEVGGSEDEVAIGIAAYTGVDTTTPIQTWAVDANETDSNFSAPALTISTQPVMLLVMIGSNAGNFAGSNTITVPSGYTERLEVHNTTYGGCYIAEKYSTSTGTAAEAVATNSAACADTTYHIALNEASSGVSVTPNNITTGAPSVAAATLTVKHSLSASAITTSAASVANATLSQNQVLVAAAITTGAPVVDDLIASFGFSVVEITTGAPAVGTLTITQVHNIALSGITTGNPVNGTATVSSGTTLALNDITTAAPSTTAVKLNNIPRFKNATSNASNATGTDTVIVNTPTHVEGDLIIAVMAIEVASTTFTPTISGWNSMWSSTPGTRALTHAGFWRRATASEPSTYSFTTVLDEWVVAAASYANASNPYSISSSPNNSSTVDCTAPTITIARADDRVVFSGATVYGTTYTPPSNFTERADVRSGTISTSVALTIADRFFESTGSTGAIVGTQANADYNVGASFAFGIAAVTVGVTCNNITTGNPTIAQATLSQNHSLHSPDITVPQPTVDSVEFFQNYSILLADITTGNPTVGDLTISALLELVAIAPSIGPPVVDDLAITQNHVLVGSEVVSGQPVVDVLGVVINFALTANNITTAAASVGSASLTQKHVLTLSDLTTGATSVENVVISQDTLVLPDDVNTGSPSVDAATISQVHSITCSGLTTGAVNIGSAALSQQHNILASDITTDIPTVENVGMNGSLTFTINNVTTGNPIVENLAVTQAHGITVSGITSGTPVVGSTAVFENQVLVALGIESQQPILGSLEALQAHVLVLSGITTNAPVAGNLELLAGITLAPSSIVTGESDVPPINVFQKHELVANGVESQAPIAGSATVSVTEVLSVDGITTQSPVLDNASVVVNVLLSAQGISTGQPDFEIPSVAQINTFTIPNLDTGNPVIGNLILGIGNTILFENIVSGLPVIDNLEIQIKSMFVAEDIVASASDVSQISILQHHNLVASTIETDEPTIENLRLNPGERSETETTYSVPDRDRVYPVRSYEKVYNVSRFGGF